MADTQRALSGYNHVSLSVTDLGRSGEWYCRVLGFEEVGRPEGEGFRRIKLRHPGTGFGLALTQHEEGDGALFDPRRTGMDHVALNAPSVAAVEAWAVHLDRLGVARSPIRRPMQAFGVGAVVLVTDPDGIPLELYAAGP